MCYVRYLICVLCLHSWPCMNVCSIDTHVVTDDAVFIRLIFHFLIYFLHAILPPSHNLLSLTRAHDADMNREKMHPAALDIAIDGPYGRSFDYSEHETVVLVAGILTLSSSSSTSFSKQSTVTIYLFDSFALVVIISYIVFLSYKAALASHP